jgi:hypothetical protein
MRLLHERTLTCKMLKVSHKDLSCSNSNLSSCTNLALNEMEVQGDRSAVDAKVKQALRDAVVVSEHSCAKNL